MKVKKVDSQGRLALPSGWRNRMVGEGGAVYVIEEADRLIIKPKRRGDLTKYFDLVEVDVNAEEFTSYKRLKKALFKVHAQ